MAEIKIENWAIDENGLWWYSRNAIPCDSFHKDYNLLYDLHMVEIEETIKENKSLLIKSKLGNVYRAHILKKAAHNPIIKCLNLVEERHVIREKEKTEEKKSIYSWIYTDKPLVKPEEWEVPVYVPQLVPVEVEKPHYEIKPRLKKKFTDM